MTKDAAQRSIRTFYETIKSGSGGCYENEPYKSNR